MTRNVPCLQPGRLRLSATHDAGAAPEGSQVKIARDRNIDALRGLAIVSVVLSHVVAEAQVPAGQDGTRLAIQAVLYLFNVQVFAFVSGYLTTRVDLTRKASTLLIPLVSWLALGAVTAWPHVVREFAGYPSGVIGVLNGGTQLWFLWALFASFAVVAILRRWPWAIVLAAIVLGFTWRYIPALSGLRTVGVILPYLVLGMTVRRFGLVDRVGPWTTLWALLGFGVTATATLSLAPLPLWVGSLMPPHPLLVLPLRMFAAAFACVALLGTARLLRGAALGLFASLGLLSLGVFGFHGFLMAALPDLFVARSLADTLARFVALLALSFGLAYLASRSDFLSKALLGGRRFSAPRAASA